MNFFIVVVNEQRMRVTCATTSYEVAKNQRDELGREFPGLVFEVVDDDHPYDVHQLSDAELEGLPDIFK